jgi:hypothetical protein
MIREMSSDRESKRLLRSFEEDWTVVDRCERFSRGGELERFSATAEEVPSSLASSTTNVEALMPTARIVELLFVFFVVYTKLLSWD